MSDQTSNDHSNYTRPRPEDARQGLRGADVLAVLAVACFLAAIGLVTFFLTTAIAG